MSILTPDASNSRIWFGSPADATGALITWRGDQTQLQIGPTTPSGYTTFLYGNGSTGMTLNSSGYLGIGDTSPDDKFTVYGGTQRARIGNSDTNHIRIGRNSTSGNFELTRTLTGVTDQVFMGAVESNNGAVYFPNGNVGIGTTTPSTKLYVEATGSTPVTVERTDGIYSLQLKGQNTTTLPALGASTNDFVVNTGGNVNMTLTSGGEASFRGITSDGTGKVVCIKSDGNLGTCTDTPGIGGDCTCN